MNSPSQFIVFGDGSWPVESLSKALPEGSSKSIWIEGKGWVMSGKYSGRGSKEISKKATIRAVENSKLSSELIAIVGFADPSKAQKVVDLLRSKSADIKILRLGGRLSSASLHQDRRSVKWQDLVQEGMETELHLLSLQEQIQELRERLDHSKSTAILLQDDPDPDGISSALALRRLLGRKAQSMPIVSFGAVTRPENLAMCRLLGIEVKTLAGSEALAQFEKVVCMDCQPSFFKGRELPFVEAIIDHHPKSDATKVYQKDAFVKVDHGIGATATLMTRYLQAAKMEVSQRLATALLYGIKSDTLSLNREVSDDDAEAFLYLYPRASHNLLTRMEKPELPLSYIDSLQKGLKDIRADKGVVVLCLGEVGQEDWIPQAADFARQVEGANWALSVGIFNNQLIICGRSIAWSCHCGDQFTTKFGFLGSAGGHRSMAKAVIPLERWIEVFDKKSIKRKELSRILVGLMLNDEEFSEQLPDAPVEASQENH